MQVNEQFFSLEPVKRAKVLDTALTRTIQSGPHAERFNELDEEKQQIALGRVRESVSKQYPNLFQIEVIPAVPMRIRTQDGQELEGKAAQTYMDEGLPKSGRMRSQALQDIDILQEPQPAQRRPIYDEGTEYLINAVRTGEVNPEDFSEQEIEQLIPLMRQAAPEKADAYVRVISDQLSEQGIEPDSFVAKSFIRGMVPGFVEDAADAVFEGIPAFDGTTDEQYERWRLIYGDIDDDFRTVGAVGGVIGTGGAGMSLLNTAMNPSKVRLAAKLVVAGAADATYSEQLPAFSAEIFNVENEPARKILTFTEGMLMAGMFDLGTTVARKLVGKDISAAKKVLSESGAENIDEKLKGEVRKLAGEAEQPTSLKTEEPPVEGGKTGKALLPQSTARKAYQRARVVLQDPYKPIKDLQRKKELTIPGDEADPYLAKRLMLPDTLAMQSAVQEEFVGVIRRVQSFEKAQDIPTGKGYELVNKYMESLHAPERNAFLKADGAAGMTTQEAKELRKAIEARPDFNEIKAISDDVKRIHSRTLDYLKEGELISAKTHKELRKRWKNHVPLQRVMDDLEDEGIVQVMSGGGPGASVQSSGLKTAVGSEREVLPVVSNVYNNLIGAIKRSNRNLANLSAYRFYQANKKQLEGLIEVGPAKGIKGDKDLIFFQDGNKMAMTIKDPALSKAFQHVPEAEQNTIIRLALSVNRYLGRLYTGWNPDFPAANKIRDAQEAAANSIRTAGLKGAAKTFLRAPADMKAVWDYGRGKNTPAAKRYQDLIDAGGSTGGLSHMTYTGLEETFERLQKNKASSVRGWLSELDSIVDRINMVFEDSTRLSAFDSARAAGATTKQAALAARDSSFDPLLRGEGGNLLSAMYLFFNPAIQSGANMARTLSNPKRALPIVGSLLGAQYALDRWNRSIDPDYRSKLSGYERGKSLVALWPDSEKDGAGFKKFTIPMGYGILPIKVANDYALEVMYGNETDDLPTAIAEIGTSLIEGYNPFGGAGKAALTPVPILAMAMQQVTNEDGLGNDIRPEWLESENIAPSEKFFDYTATTKGGKMAIEIARELDKNGIEVNPENMLFWYRNLTGGPGKTVRNLFELTSDIYNGTAPDPNHIPIFRRFFSVTPDDIAQSRMEKDDSIQKAEREYLTDKAKRQRDLRMDAKTVVEAEAAQERNEAMQRLRDAVAANPSDGRYVESRIKQELLDLSQDDRRIKRFGVNDGGRAQLYNELTERMAPAEAEAFLRKQAEKKLLTPEVWNQMQYLRQGRQNN